MSTLENRRSDVRFYDILESHETFRFTQAGGRSVLCCQPLDGAQRHGRVAIVTAGAHHAGSGAGMGSPVASVIRSASISARKEIAPFHGDYGGRAGLLPWRASDDAIHCGLAVGLAAGAEPRVKAPSAIRIPRSGTLTKLQNIDNCRYMELISAIEAFAALSQATRITAFRLIMKHQPEGLAAGEVARLLDVPQNTMSTHLAILERAGLLSSERRSRSIIYRAELDRVREITSFLVNDCCGGRPELCEPLIAEFTSCCTPKEHASAS